MVDAPQAMLTLLTTDTLATWSLTVGFVAVVLSVLGVADILTGDPVARRVRSSGLLRRQVEFGWTAVSACPPATCARLSHPT